MSTEKVQKVEQWLIKRLREILDTRDLPLTSTSRLDHLGLDSLSEAGLAIELEQEFGVSVSLTTLMRHPQLPK